MTSFTDRDALLQRQRDLLNELEQIEDVTDEEDVIPEARLADIRNELSEIERRLNPEATDQRRHEGRSDSDAV